MNETDTRQIDPRAFRDVLGCYPTGVAVIASANDGERSGLVVGTFTSISLNPPLVGFFPSKDSRSWPRIAESGRFCVNILGVKQIDLCKHFASKIEDKFADLSHGVSPSGLPLIDHAVAWIDCRIDSVQEIGDHYFVVGSVEAMGKAEDPNPLIFLRGGYHASATIVVE